MHAKSIGVADAFPNLEEVQILFDNYFNAGFLALNLKSWREENLENQLIGFFLLKNEKLLLIVNKNIQRHFLRLNKRLI